MEFVVETEISLSVGVDRYATSDGSGSMVWIARGDDGGDDGAESE